MTLCHWIHWIHRIVLSMPAPLALPAQLQLHYLALTNMLPSPFLLPMPGTWLTLARDACMSAQAHALFCQLVDRKKLTKVRSRVHQAFLSMAAAHAVHSDPAVQELHVFNQQYKQYASVQQGANTAVLSTHMCYLSSHVKQAAFKITTSLLPC